MTPLWHKSLMNRFSTLPEFQQILMVANELNRAQNMREVENEYKNALERALELIDFVCMDPRWKRKLGELRRAREVMAMYYSDPGQDTKILQRCLIQLEPQAWKKVSPKV